jgi:hypothetical protein
MAAEDKSSRPGRIYTTIGYPATARVTGLRRQADLQLPLKASTRPTGNRKGWRIRYQNKGNQISQRLIVP